MVKENRLLLASRFGAMPTFSGNIHACSLYCYIYDIGVPGRVSRKNIIEFHGDFSADTGGQSPISGYFPDRCQIP